MRLVYANQTEEDILLKRELDEMAKDKRAGAGQEQPCCLLRARQAGHLHMPGCANAREQRASMAVW